MKRKAKLSKIKKTSQKKRKQKAKNCDAEDMSMGKLVAILRKEIKEGKE